MMFTVAVVIGRLSDLYRPTCYILCIYMYVSIYYDWVVLLFVFFCMDLGIKWRIFITRFTFVSFEMAPLFSDVATHYDYTFTLCLPNTMNSFII